MRLALISSAVQAGWSSRISAAAPATCGVAIDVPLSRRYPPPSLAELIGYPGASRSGLIANKRLEGPRELKKAITSVLFTAPTVRAFRAHPGELIVWYPEPLFPAAAAHTTPPVVALSIAGESASFGLPDPPMLRLRTEIGVGVEGLLSGSRARLTPAMIWEKRRSEERRVGKECRSR